MPTPRQIVEDIRRNQYGIGLPADPASRPVIAAMRSKLDRALKLLSTDLYAKDIHFVLELLQNAEDNSYAPGVIPEVRFILTNDAILVQNNEVGFAEVNVRSLCDVANSSKKKRLGYIGEKGIGFKSVFRVTDEPLILSNGFRFSLPLHDPDTNLGYVIPVWREDVPAGLDPSQTNIYLPLTSKGRGELPRVADIHPSLLLFLKKLRKIDIRDGAGASTRWICRDGDGDRIDIRSNSGTDRWRVDRQSLSVPPDVVDEKRDGVSTVELVLAFPLTEDGTPDSSTERPVYSFLPIRPYGFRFAIQGDFILASSREDILTDRPWNQWLRDSISPLFLKAVELFKTDQALRTTYLAFLPSSTDVTDPFFETVPGNIVELLKETECILTASGRWAKPSEVLLASGTARQLFTNDDIKKHLQKELVHEAFKADARVLQLLEVPSFSFNDLIACLTDTSWVASKGDSWLVRMLAYLNTWTWNEAGLKTIRQANIVPLENGQLASPSGGQIFFPLDKRTTYGFEEGLRVIKRGLFKAGDGTTVDAARKFLRGSLGVRPADPHEIINEHILPVFEGDKPDTNWKSKDASFLLGSVEYIKDHLEQFEKGGGSVERLKRSLYIKFVHPEGHWYTRPSELYISKTYGNKHDLEGVFSGLADIHFLDSAYLDHSVSRLGKAAKQGVSSAKQRRDLADSWRGFFARLGAEVTIRVTCPAEVNDPAQVASADLAKVINTGDPERISTALRILDANWARYRRFLEIERFYTQRNRRYSFGKEPTAFCKLLRGSDWIPTKEHGLCKPAEVCLDVEANRSLLGNHVPYLAVDLSNEDFIEDLGIEAEPTVDAVLLCLHELVEERIEDLAQFRSLYRFLDQHFEEGSTSISSAFQSQALIYIPSQPGRFQKAPEVFWKDVSWLFGETRGYLSKPWKELKGFFVDKLGVSLTPCPQDYVDLLKELSQRAPLPSEDEAKVWEVYRELERRLSGGENDEDPRDSAWWHDFASSALYWTDRQEFWQNEDDLYVNDHDEFYPLFQDQDGCAFLRLPENQFPSFRRLIEAGGLRKLSEAVRVAEVVPRQPHQEKAITKVVRQAAPFIIRYLYFNENEVYRTLEDAGTLRQTGEISVCVCESLDVVLEFRDAQTTVARDVAGVFPRLYVREGADDRRDRIGGILAKLFHNPRGLDSFICLLLTKESTAAMERLMETLQIPAMPADVDPPLSAPSTEDDENSGEEGHVEETGTEAGVEGELTDVPAAEGAEDEDHGEERGRDQSRAPAGTTSRSGSSGSPPSSTSEWNEGEEAEDAGDDGDDHTSDRDSKEATEGDSRTPSHFGAGTGRRRQLGENAGQDDEDREDGNRPLDGARPPTGNRPEGDREKSQDRPPRERPAKNWFRVLARPGESTESSGTGNPPPSDDAARRQVMEYEERRGRPATAAGSNQEGYDVSSEDRHRGVRRLIEVKGLQQRWTGDATVTLTGAQFDASRGEPPLGCEYWLYVVDGLGTDSPRVHPIPRFAAKVERVYLQAQDWLPEVDQADRDRLTEASVGRLGLPIVDFDVVVEQRPTTAFLTRYPNKDLADIVPAGGFLKCLPLDPTGPLPPKGRLVMLLPGQGDKPGSLCHPFVGELRWSVRQSLEGENQYAEVSLRPKTADPAAKPRTIRVSMADWPSFRPYAVCEPLVEI